MSAILYPGGGLSPAPIQLSRPGTKQALKPVGNSRGTGLAVVILIHGVVGWALASGLAHDAIQIIRKPIELAIIPEVVPPPPPPPPPRIEKIKEAPKPLAPPPPAYVPPPEVVPPVVSPAPVIRAVQAEPPKEPVVIAPPPPPAPPAPAPAPEPKPVIVKQEISLACPGYQNVLAQMLEEAIDRVGVTGTVSTRLLVRGSQVVDATVLSGPKEYHKYVQAAVKRMKCSAGGAEEVQVALNINFSK